jgi:hypothetical protein
MKKLLIPLFMASLSFGQAPQYLPTPNPGEPIRLVRPALTGSGAPSNPCSFVGQFYINTAGSAVYACPSNGGNWFNVGITSGGSGTVTTITWPTIPSWLTASIANPTTTPALSVTPTSGQTSHQVIGTCGAAITFAPCLLVAADIPTLNQNTTGNAATATALAANGTDCAANQFSSGIDASGNATGCATPFSLTTTGTSGASTFSGGVLNIPQYTGGGSSAFSAITGSTNTTAAMLVGTGASLGPTGTGTVSANNTGFGLTMSSSNMAVNTTAVPSITTFLQGNNDVAISTTGTTLYIACPVSGASTSVLTTNMHVQLNVDTTNASGAASLNLCDFGVKSIKPYTGSSDAASNVIPTLTDFEVQYDGTYWRLPQWMTTSGSQTYPSAGIMVSTGSGFGTSLSDPLTGTHGGTGVNNGTFTVTLGGNLATTGAFNTTFAQGATTTQTLPATSQTIPGMNQTNTGGAAFTLDMNAATSASAFRVPNIAGGTSTVAGSILYDPTNKNWHMGGNGVDNINIVMPSSITPANNDCAKFTLAAGVYTLNTAGAACGSGSISGLTTGFLPKASSATAIANSLVDEGITTVNTLTAANTAGLAVPNGPVKVGTSPPTPTAGTSGGIAFTGGTGPTAVAAGVAAYYATASGQAAVEENNAITPQVVSKTMNINVTPVTVNANVTTFQNLQAFTIPANTLNIVGRTLRVSTAGTYTTPAANASAITYTVKLCTVSGCGSGTVVTVITFTSSAQAGSQTTDPWNSIAMITTQTAGASSVFESHGNFTIDLTGVGVASSVFPDSNSAVSSAIDTTGQLFLQTTCAFSVASASNTCVGRQMILEVLN